MSDTSTLFGIKYKGKMIELPKDSSVSWNDLEDKPTTKTQIGVNIYEDIQGQPVSLYYEQYGNNELDYAIRTTVSKGYFEFYVNPGFVYYDATYTDGNGNTQSLTEEQKKYLVMYCYENGQYRSKIILYLPYNGSEPTSEDVQKVLIDSEDIEDVSISLNNYSSPYYGGGKFNVQMYPTFKGSTTINDLYTQTDTNKSWKVGVLDKVYSEMFDSSVIDAYTKAEADNKFALDTSVSELWDTSAGPDLSDYYTKTQIDTSIANNYASKNDISAFITSNDVSTFVTNNDISTFITANDVSNKLEANDVSIYLTDNDISTFITSNDTSDFVTKTELFDISTTPGSTVPASVVKGEEMYVGPGGNDYTSTMIVTNWTSQPYRGYIPIRQNNEGDDLWVYSYFGDYCYIEFTYNNVTYWFVIYKDGSIVMTSDNIEGKVSDGVYYNGNFVYYLDDTTFPGYSIQSVNVYFYSCTYTPSQVIPGQSTYSIKSEYLNGLDTSVSQLWDTSTQGGGSGISLQYLTQAEYDALQVKDPSTLYLIEETL